MLVRRVFIDLEHYLYVGKKSFYRFTTLLWRVWRHQKGNQNPYIEEEQTTQWSKENTNNTMTNRKYKQYNDQ
jgi:hypothetical protein